MKIIKRIIKAPSIINRAPIGLAVVPKYPNLEAYRDRVVGGLDEKEYEEIIYASEHEQYMRIYCSSLLPAEVGYIIQHEDKIFAVPIPAMKGFMRSAKVTETEHSKYDLWAELSSDNRLYMHNDEPAVESPEIAFIYYTDAKGFEQTRLPIDKTFRVFTKTGVKTIRPKGDATVYGIKLCNPELLPVIRGEIVDVSGNAKFIP